MEPLSTLKKLLGILLCLLYSFVFTSGTVVAAPSLKVQQTIVAAPLDHLMETDAAFYAENSVFPPATDGVFARQQQGDEILQQVDAIMPTADDLELPQPPFVLRTGGSGILTVDQYLGAFQSEPEKIAFIQQVVADYHFMGRVSREWNVWGETWGADTQCPDFVYMTVGSHVFLVGSEDEAVGFVADTNLQQAWMDTADNQTVEILESSPSVFSARRTFDSRCGKLVQYTSAGHIGPFVVEADIIAYANVREGDMWGKMDKINALVMQRLGQLLSVSAQPANNDCPPTPGVLHTFNVYARSAADGPTVVNSGGSYWIRMSIGYGAEGEAEARAEQPDISLSVTMNGIELPMAGPTQVEYNDGAGIWEINSYHCTGPLAPGIYSIVGTSYRGGEVVDSASFVLLAKPG